MSAGVVSRGRWYTVLMGGEALHLFSWRKPRLVHQPLCWHNRWRCEWSVMIRGNQKVVVGMGASAQEAYGRCVLEAAYQWSTLQRRGAHE